MPSFELNLLAQKGRFRDPGNVRLCYTRHGKASCTDTEAPILRIDDELGSKRTWKSASIAQWNQKLFKDGICVLLNCTLEVPHVQRTIIVASVDAVGRR